MRLVRIARRAWYRNQRNVIALRRSTERSRLLITVHRDQDTEVSARIREGGIWEPNETLLVENLVQPGHCVLDVGANIGYFTLIAADLVGSSGRVLAFEPEPRNFGLLVRNVEINGLENVEAYAVALSDESAPGKLYMNERNLGDHRIFAGAEPSTRRAVDTVQLEGDSLLPAPSKIDFLKIDTQGSELRVLRGLRQAIDRSLPDLAILVEITPNALEAAGTPAASLIEFLAEREFNFYLLSRACLVPISERTLRRWIQVALFDPANEGFTNVLCVHRAGAAELGWKELPVLQVDPLDILFGDAIETWDGRKLDRSHIGSMLYFRSGWEVDCSMCDEIATFLFRPRSVRTDSRRIAVRIQGQYSGVRRKLEVCVNGASAGDHFLDDGEISVPSSAFFADKTIVSIARKTSEASSRFCFSSISWREADEMDEPSSG